MSPVSPQGSRHKLSSFIRLESVADFKPMRVCVCSAYLRALLWTMIGNVELLSSPAPDNTELQRSPRPAPGTRGQQPIRGQYPGTWPIRGQVRDDTSPANGGYCNQPRYDISYRPCSQSKHYLTMSWDGKWAQGKVLCIFQHSKFRQRDLIQSTSRVESYETWERPCCVKAGIKMTHSGVPALAALTALCFEIFTSYSLRDGSAGA